MSIKVGARNFITLLLSEIARAFPSPQDRAGSWQLAHEWEDEPESIGSKKSVFPSSILARSLASAAANPGGGRYFARNAMSTATLSAEAAMAHNASSRPAIRAAKMRIELRTQVSL